MPARVLIIEDDVLQRENLSVLVTLCGHRVCGATSTGELAIAIAKSAHPDVVIVDGALAGHVDGIYAAERIREIRQCGIVILTGRSEIAADERVQLLRPDAVIRKPASGEEIAAAIDCAVRRIARAERDSTTQNSSVFIRS
jgi:DNA-binding NarL/FixJ family response regulator